MDTSARWVNPAVSQYELWPGPQGYPWADTGIRLWTREGILRRMSPGNLMCTWTTGGYSEPVPGNYTMVSYSRDDGQTWTPPQVLFRHSHRGLFTTELFVPRDGEIHAFLQTYGMGTWMTQLHSYRAISRDCGQTWVGPHSIPGGAQNVWVNQGIVHSSGRWVIPVSWSEHIGEEWCEPSVGQPAMSPCVGGRVAPMVQLPWGGDTQLWYRTGNAWADRNHRYPIGVLISDDGGASFSVRGYLCRQTPNHFIEPKVVELTGGRLAMLTREKSGGWLWRSDSLDCGETWSALECTSIPNPSSKVRLLRASDGRTYLIHNPTGADGAHWGHRSPLSLWVSEDDMRTWAVKVDLVRDPNRNLNYPDGYIDEQSRHLCFAWEDAYSVYIMRVPMDIH